MLVRLLWLGYAKLSLVVLQRSAMFGCGGLDNLAVRDALVSRVLRGAGGRIRDWTLPLGSVVWAGGFLFDVVSGRRLFVVRRDVVFGC